MASPTAQAEASGGGERVTLVRDLTLFSSTMIGVGAMIGAGIFVLTGIGAGIAGPALIVAFVLNGIATIFTAMVYAELGSCFPDAGGGYLWVKEALPQPSGFLSGWMSWYAHFVACSLYAVGFGSFFTRFLDTLGFHFWGLEIELVTKIVAVLVILAFTAINLRGASETGLAGNIVTVTKVLALFAFIGFGLAATFKNPNWWHNFEPFAPNGMLGIFVAMGVTFIGFEGYEIIAQSSEEIIDPKRNIPKAILYSLVIVVPIYVLVAFVAIGGLMDVGMPVWQYLGQHEELAMAEAARLFMPGGIFVLLFAGLMSTSSALNATVYSSSRVSFAMGRDHNLPDFFSHISSRTNTPSFAILASSAFIIVGALTLPIEDIAAGTVIMFKLLFLLVNVAVINLRRNRPDLDRGYVIPWFPAVPIIGIVVKVLLAIFLYELSPIAWYTAIAWIIGGVIFYYVYSRPREIERTQTPLIQEVVEPHTRRHNILIAAAHEGHLRSLSGIAASIGRAKGSAIWGLHAVKVPSILPVGSAREIALERQPLLDKMADQMPEDLPVNWMLRATHGVGQAIRDSVRAKDINLLVLGWPGSDGGTVPSPLGKTIEWVLRRIDCDIVAVRPPNDGSEPDLSRPVVPIRGSEHSRFAVEISQAVSSSEKVHYIHIASTDAQPDVKRMAKRLGLVEGDIHLRLVGGRGPELSKQVIADEIVGYAEQVGATSIVMGASEEGIVYRKIFGDVPLDVSERFPGAFVLTKRYSGQIKSYLQEFFGSRPTEDLSDVEY